MSRSGVSTRRHFLSGAGAALSVPLMASAALAAEGRQHTSGGSTERLAALEAANAIRALQREYARLVNAGAHAEAVRLFAEPTAAPVDATLRRLAADRFTAHDVIDVAPGGATATARLECTVETETVLDGRYTLVDMLREQGEGALRAVERRVLQSAYVKQGNVWKIAHLALRPA
jgi:hypothetical protein